MDMFEDQSYAIDSLCHTPYFQDSSESLSIINNNTNVISNTIIPNLPDIVALSFINGLEGNLARIEGAT